MTLDIPPGEFQAYIFDCDGTLADTMPLHYRAWQDTIRPHGLNLPEDVFYSLGGVPTPGVVEYLNSLYGWTLPPMPTARQKETRFMELLPEVKPIMPVLEFMRLVKARGFPVAVASGGFKQVVEATLHAMGVFEHFGAIVTLEDVVNGKPAPDTYLEAARRLGVDPAGCLVFEDTPLGQDSALAAGMQCVLVASGPIVKRQEL